MACFVFQSTLFYISLLLRCNPLNTTTAQITPIARPCDYLVSPCRPVNPRGVGSRGPLSSPEAAAITEGVTPAGRPPTCIVARWAIKGPVVLTPPSTLDALQAPIVLTPPPTPRRSPSPSLDDAYYDGGSSSGGGGGGDNQSSWSSSLGKIETEDRFGLLVPPGCHLPHNCHGEGAPRPPGRPVQHYRPSVVLGRQELRRRQRPVSEGGSRHIPHVQWSAAVRKCPMHFRQAATGRTNGTRAARPACPAEGDPPAGTTRPPRGR